MNALFALLFFAPDQRWICTKGRHSFLLSHEPKKSNLNEIGIQILKTSLGTVAYLNLYVDSFIVDENQEVEIYLQTPSVSKTFKAHCLEGKQRCILPDEALATLRDHLRLGETVTIYTYDNRVDVKPGKFNKFSEKLL